MSGVLLGLPQGTEVAEPEQALLLCSGGTSVSTGRLASKNVAQEQRMPLPGRHSAIVPDDSELLTDRPCGWAVGGFGQPPEASLPVCSADGFRFRPVFHMTDESEVFGICGARGC